METILEVAGLVQELQYPGLKAEGGRRSTASRSRSTGARRWRWSANRAPARPRSGAASSASRSRPAGGCCSGARSSRARTACADRTCAVKIQLVFQEPAKIARSAHADREFDRGAAQGARPAGERARRSGRSGRSGASICAPPCSTSIGPRSAPGSSSGSASRARSSPTRRWSCSTSRPRRSTRQRAPRSSTCCWRFSRRPAPPIC